MALLAEEFNALLATLPVACAVTVLSLTLTTATPAAVFNSAPTTEVLAMLAFVVAFSPMACRLCTTPEASKRLLALRVKLLLAVLALARANRALPLTVTLPPVMKRPEEMNPLVPASTEASAVPSVNWEFITAKSAPTLDTVPAVGAETERPLPKRLEPVTVKVLKASLMPANADALFPETVMAPEVT